MNFPVRIQAQVQTKHLDFYTGQERRTERRRGKSNERIKQLIKNFGLDLRVLTDRRQANTSWLLKSK